MELDTVKLFIDVMQRGSFAAVARDRNVDPSSVSRIVASLEAHLGTRLFQRTTRSLAPTEAAVAYLEQVEPIIAQLDRAALLAADSSETPRGTLRITAATTFAQLNIVPLLPELAKRYPELAFDLVLTDRMVDLVEERIDVAVRLGVLPESSLIAHRLCSMVHVIAGSPDYLRRRGHPKSPHDVEKHACLRYPVTGYSRWRFRDAAGTVTEVPVRGRVTASNGVALRTCAVAGMGLVLLPRWNIAEELRSGALVQILPEYDATMSEFDGAAWLLYPSRSYLPRKVRVFADFLRTKFAHGAPNEVGLFEPVTSKRGGRRRRS